MSSSIEQPVSSPSSRPTPTASPAPIEDTPPPTTTPSSLRHATEPQSPWLTPTPGQCPFVARRMPPCADHHVDYRRAQYATLAPCYSATISRSRSRDACEVKDLRCVRLCVVSPTQSAPGLPLRSNGLWRWRHECRVCLRRRRETLSHEVFERIFEFTFSC